MRTGDAGAYSVRISNSYGNVTSAIAFLTVNPVAIPSVSIAADPVAHQIHLSWPTNALGFVLQSTTDLSPSGNWTNDTNTPAVVGGEFSVTTGAPDSIRFYRLRKL